MEKDKITFAEKLQEYSRNSSYNVSQLFDDSLRYIIHGFTINMNNVPLDGWKYSEEDNKMFFDLFSVLAHEYDENVKEEKKWYDAFGHTYETLIAGKGRRDSGGQFFTPPHICDLMAEIAMGTQEKGESINDSCCGSGRNLLAGHALNLSAKCYGEDLDPTCVRMTTLNMLFHGIVGETVCHNSLFPDTTFRFGYAVNRNLNNPLSQYFGIPHLEFIDKETYLRASQIKEEEHPTEQQTEQIAEQVVEQVQEQPQQQEKQQQPVQLELF